MSRYNRIDHLVRKVQTSRGEIDVEFLVSERGLSIDAAIDRIKLFESDHDERKLFKMCRSDLRRRRRSVNVFGVKLSMVELAVLLNMTPDYVRRRINSREVISRLIKPR